MLNIKTLNLTGMPVKELDFRHLLSNAMILRNQVKFLMERMKGTQVELIVGPRRSGKTTVVFDVISRLLQQGISGQQIIYVNVKEHTEEKFLKDSLLFWENIRAHLETKERLYIFFDEVGLASQALDFLLSLKQLAPNAKLVATTSRELIFSGISAEIRRTLIYPVSLVEWVNHKETFIQKIRQEIYPLSGRAFAKQMTAFDQSYGQKVKEAFYELALFGGYPEVLLEKREARWKKLEEIIFSTLMPVDLETAGIDKPALMQKLFSVLASQGGSLANYSELSDLLRASHITVKKYHAFLASHLLIHLLPPLTGRKASEIKQAQKTFFCDNGFYHQALGQTGNHIFSITPEAIKNMLCTEIIKNLNYRSQVFFWQTNTGTQVDFVVGSGTKYRIPIAVKSGEARPKKLTRSLHSFLKTYKPERALFVNESLIDSYHVGDTEVLYLPYYWVPVLEGLWQ